MAARKIKPLLDAVEPFRRVLAINEPLGISDDVPLARIIPSAWPTVGELRALVDLATKVACGEQT